MTEVNPFIAVQNELPNYLKEMPEADQERVIAYVKSMIRLSFLNGRSAGTSNRTRPERAVNQAR